MAHTESARAASSAALFDAIKQGDLDQVTVLLDAEASLADSRNDQELSPLMVATYWKRSAIIGLLLGRGAEDDLFAAVARGDLLAVEMILDADPSLIDGFSVDGWTPLALAAHFGSVDVVGHLLTSGANVNAVSRNSLANTPLHSAIAGDQLEAAELLLSQGTDVNAVDAGGWTPLNLAAHAGQSALVTKLLAAGADPTIVNEGGQTPLEAAREQGWSDVIEILQEPLPE